MKLLLSVLALVLLCASAHGQDGNVIVNPGSTISCTTDGETGFTAKNWTIGGTVAGSFTGTGGGAGVSAPALRDLVITKTFDSCSEKLIKAFLMGSTTAIPTLTLTQYSAAKGDAKPIPLIVITLTDALINLYTVSGAPNVNPVETLDFNYKKMCIASTTMNAEGASSTTKVCYNVSSDKLS